MSASSTRTVPRIGWTELAPGLRAAIEADLGAEVIEWRSQEEGFSPGFASRCRLADGSNVFLKALPSQLVELSGEIFRHEIAVNRALPEHAPAPRLLSDLDVAEGLAAAYADVEGRTPETPWRTDELVGVLQTVDELELPPDPRLPDVRGLHRLASTRRRRSRRSHRHRTVAGRTNPDPAGRGRERVDHPL